MSQAGEGDLHIEVQGDVVMLQGDLDMDTAGDLTTTLKGIEGRVVLDLGGVTFLDSTGLQCMVHARDAALQRGQNLTLRNPSPAVRRVFDVTNMWATFDVEQ